MTHVDYQAGPGGVWIKPGLAPLFSRLRILVFDVDGVLIRTGASYPRAVSEAVQYYFSRILRWPGTVQLVTPEETHPFKLAGGFNDDWHLAQALALFYLAKAARIGAADLGALRQAPPSLADFAAAVKAAGGGVAGAEQVALAGLPAELRAGVLADWDRDLITRLCQELYGGTDGCAPMFGFAPRYIRAPGLYNTDQPLVAAERLRQVPYRLGVYTGRAMQEALVGLKACGLAELFPPERVCASDGPYRKPDPGGLRHLGDLLGSGPGLFFGDNIDDIRTVIRYRNEVADGPPFLFAGILGGVLGEAAEPTFRELGADLIAPDVGAVLDFLAQA